MGGTAACVLGCRLPKQTPSSPVLSGRGDRVGLPDVLVSEVVHVRGRDEYVEVATTVPYDGALKIPRTPGVSSR
jgi:hypothetical protein